MDTKRFAFLGVAMAANLTLSLLLHIPYLDAVFLTLLVPKLKKVDLLAINLFEGFMFSLKNIEVLGALILFFPAFYSVTATIETYILYYLLRNRKWYKRIWRGLT